MSGYDYIVVGAGSAGAIIAARLAEDPKAQVLLLEAGGSDRTVLVRKPGMISLVHQIGQLKAKVDWGFYTAPQRHLNDRKIPYTRGKVIGGSSSVNGMLYLRGNEKNYNDWAALGCNGWGFEEVKPFFQKLEDYEGGQPGYHGEGGPVRVSRHPDDAISPVSEAWNEAAAAVEGIPILDTFNGPNQNCVSFYHMSSRDGVRNGTGEVYVQPSLERPNFTAEARALVHRVTIEGGRATGVDYEQAGELKHARAEREVILAGGVIGSPHMLLLSGVGPAEHLREHGVEVKVDLPGVGKNLHDHLFVPLTYRARTSKHRGTARHFFAGMIQEFAVGDGWFGRTVFEGGAFIKSTASQPIPDIQLHTLPWGYPDPNQDGPGRAYVDPGNCLTVMPTIIYPKSRGEVMLTSSDPSAAPHIDPHFLEEPDDMDILVTGIQRAREICAHEALRDHLVEELAPGSHRASIDELQDEVRLRAMTVYHPVGSCKMGVDDMAVVDPQLRVRGVDGLRVADASIMPSVTGGNTNAPSMMIGERAAALIGGRSPTPKS